MTAQQDARERAWRGWDYRHAREQDAEGYEVWEWYSEPSGTWIPTTQHVNLVNAIRAEQKREDEERIAALVAAEVALRELLNIHTKCVSRNEETGELNVDPLCTLYYDLQIHLDGGSYPQWRALANRTEAERGGTD